MYFGACRIRLPVPKALAHRRPGVSGEGPCGGSRGWASLHYPCFATSKIFQNKKARNTAFYFAPYQRNGRFKCKWKHALRRLAQHSIALCDALLRGCNNATPKENLPALSNDHRLHHTKGLIVLRGWCQVALHYGSISKSKRRSDNEHPFRRVENPFIFVGAHGGFVLSLITFFIKCKLPNRVLLQVRQGEVVNLLSNFHRAFREAQHRSEGRPKRGLEKPWNCRTVRSFAAWFLEHTLPCWLFLTELPANVAWAKRSVPARAKHQTASADEACPPLLAGLAPKVSIKALDSRLNSGLRLKTRFGCLL